MRTAPLSGRAKGVAFDEPHAWHGSPPCQGGEQRGGNVGDKDSRQVPPLDPHDIVELRSYQFLY